MNFILYDFIPTWKKLFPITFTRPISNIKIGILSIKKRWEKYIGKRITCVYTELFLLEKFSKIEKKKVYRDVCLINSSYFPNENLIRRILSLKEDELIIKNGEIVSMRKKEFSYKDYYKYLCNNYYKKYVDCFIKKSYLYEKIIFRIKNISDILTNNKHFIEKDFKFLVKKNNKKSCSIFGKENIILNKIDIFLEENLKINQVILDAEKGPIYIEKGAKIMHGSVIVGPVFIGKNSTLNFGSKIYNGTSINSFCKVGGEIQNSILFSYSNKVHDGFLGSSILGEWCNLGAGTNVSNLRNDYCKVTIWDYEKKEFIPTKLQFFGTIMGDHSKTSINTQFNTSTIVGVGSNIFGYGFPPRYIPSFSLGGIQKKMKIPFYKFCETASIVMKRRNKNFSHIEKNILKHIYEMNLDC